MTGREVLLYLSLKYEGDWAQVFDAVKSREKVDYAKAEEMFKQPIGQYVTIVDSEYPKCIHNSCRPPLVLYYRGNLELLRNKTRNIGYIGSRNASEYGIRMARNICGGLAKKGVTIVNGMARGIDAEALRASLDNGGKGIAVLGSGIDNPYPASSKDVYEKLLQNGLIISEFPLKTEPRKDRFPARNRLIAACSHSLIVGEASYHSGSLITVNFAAGYVSEIGAVPYPADSESACNRLIKDGATLIESAEDAFQMLPE